MTIISITSLRTKIRKLADLVAFGGERIIVRRNNETAFVMIPEEDAAILEAFEHKAGLKAAKKAMRQKRTIPLDKLKKKLKL